MEKRQKLTFLYVFTLIALCCNLNILWSSSFKEKTQAKANSSKSILAEKPVIYLYSPIGLKDVMVELEADFTDQILMIPQGEEQTTQDRKVFSWVVNVEPSDESVSKIVHDGKEYPYLFWESEMLLDRFKIITGDLLKPENAILIERNNIHIALEEMLTAYGFNELEMNEFIRFWAPRLMANDKNLIWLKSENFSKAFPLTVTPQPDNVFRFYVVMKKASRVQAEKARKLEIAISGITPMTRGGFTVVEWGGTILN